MIEQAFKLSKDKTQFIRDTHGMSARLCETLTLEPMTLSNYLHGKRHTPASVLIALCKATSKKPSDFIEDRVEKKIANQLIEG